MISLLYASYDISDLWYLLPLVVVVSLVYGATRHELMSPILHHAFKAGVWIVGFMAVIFVILMWASWGL